jgi:hypothetical protein
MASVEVKVDPSEWFNRVVRMALAGVASHGGSIVLDIGAVERA